jgi:uncharacterized membrane protein YhaH (DUF805 family)
MSRQQFKQNAISYTVCLIALLLIEALSIGGALATGTCKGLACGYIWLAVFAATYALVLPAYSIAMLFLIARRCKSAGLAAWWVPSCIIWLLATDSFLRVGLRFPVSLAFFYAFVVFLCFCDEGGALNISRNRWIAVWITAVAGVASSLWYALDTLATLLSFVGVNDLFAEHVANEIAWPFAMPFGYRIWGGYGSLIALSAFAASLVLVILAQKRKPGITEVSTSTGG